MRIDDVIKNNQYVCFSGEYGINTIDLGNENIEVNNIEYQKTVKFKELKDIDKAAYNYIKSNGADGAENEDVLVYIVDDGIIYAPVFWQ